ncbi:hypothetical protein AYO44_11970 [Planctomycetaceae bacterium SCGC AG-212-F19]|nr:hypothetical protein AYO44_11970 [Planctomycetaceae bacterium SCGC AG-212-F19]
MPTAARPAVWAIPLAFATVYLAYGLNYLAIAIGDQTLPPFLFAGAHVTLAGLLLFAWVVVRREPIAVSLPNIGWAALGGIIVFVGGTGLVTAGQKEGVHSGMASLLRATTPIWLALFEWLRPRGERLSSRAWLGISVAIAGLVLVLAPSFEAAPDPSKDIGLLLVMGSALSWALGALVLRHRRPTPSNTLATAYQMTLGGLAMIGVGLALGEPRAFAAAELTWEALGAFAFLLIVHSLIGFSALNWLLRHVSAPLALTKFYVSPAVAVAVGALILHEQITGVMLGGMALILGGVIFALMSTERQAGSEPDPPTKTEELAPSK